MDPKDLEFEETLADSELLLKNTARSMDEDAEFTLESILAEYGSGTPAALEPEEKASEPPAEEKQSAKVVPLPKRRRRRKKRWMKRRMRPPASLSSPSPVRKRPKSWWKPSRKKLPKKSPRRTTSPSP